jgi:hypothetical protein
MEAPHSVLAQGLLLLAVFGPNVEALIVDERCLRSFRPVRRCKTVMCMHDNDREEHFEHMVPEDLEQWWEDTSSGRCTSYVWETFATNETEMITELSQHIIFGDRDTEAPLPEFLLDIIRHPSDTFCEAIAQRNTASEKPGLCWRDSNRTVPRFTVIGNSHAAVWRFSRQRVQNIFDLGKYDGRGATAYGLKNTNSATGAAAKFSEVIMRASMSVEAAANNVLIIQLGQVDVDSLLGLRKMRAEQKGRNTVTIEQQIDASIANLVSFLKTQKARWRFARIVLVSGD